MGKHSLAIKGPPRKGPPRIAELAYARKHPNRLSRGNRLRFPSLGSGTPIGVGRRGRALSPGIIRPQRRRCVGSRHHGRSFGSSCFGGQRSTLSLQRLPIQRHFKLDFAHAGGRFGTSRRLAHIQRRCYNVGSKSQAGAVPGSHAGSGGPGSFHTPRKNRHKSHHD